MLSYHIRERPLFLAIAIGSDSVSQHELVRCWNTDHLVMAYAEDRSAPIHRREGSTLRKTLSFPAARSPPLGPSCHLAARAGSSSSSNSVSSSSYSVVLQQAVVYSNNSSEQHQQQRWCVPTSWCLCCVITYSHVLAAAAAVHVANLMFLLARRLSLLLVLRSALAFAAVVAMFRCAAFSAAAYLTRYLLVLLRRLCFLCGGNSRTFVSVDGRAIAIVIVSQASTSPSLLLAFFSRQNLS